jgi:hypothetical protein
MTRRVWVLAVIVAALIGSVLISVLPARASHPRDIAPSAIDPAWLALPASALPAGAVVDHSAVSDNADANGTTTPPDGHKSQLRQIHQKGYDQLGRLTGYRLDFRFTLQGTPAGTEYLASIYPDANTAKAAMDDAVTFPALIVLIGTPLPTPCTVGDECKAYSGSVPGGVNGVPYTAVLAIYRRGPIVVETATQVPTASFNALESVLATTLFGFLSAADIQVQIALSGGPTKAPTNTPTTEPATATPTATATATNTAVPTDTPTKTKPAAKKCPKNASKKHGKCACKKGYVLKHGKCMKKKP